MCVPPPFASMYRRHAQKTENIILGIVSFSIRARYSACKHELTPASIIVLSSQPKFEMTYVRVHIRNEMKDQANIKKAIVILSCCFPDRAISIALCPAMLEVASSYRSTCDVSNRLDGIAV
jgi:hypothetical protein